MKASIKAGKLQEAMGKIGSVVPSATTMPVLQTVKITTDNGSLVLTASNIETNLSLVVGCDLETDGGLCVPYKSFNGWLQAMNGNEVVSLEADLKANSLGVICGNYDVSFRGFSVEDFPMVDNVSGNDFTVDASALRRVLENTLFAIATDESRPIMTGVNLTFEDALTVVATDSFRLSLDVAMVESKFSEVLSVTPTGTALRVLLRLLSKEAGQITGAISHGGNMVSFKTDDMVFSCAALEGQYPDVKAIIPVSFQKEITVNKGDFSRMLQSAAVFTRDAGDIVVFEVNNDTLVCSAVSSQVGPFEVELPITFVSDAPEFKFGLNRQYMADVLSVIEGDDITIFAVDEDKPFVLRGDGSAIFLIMPMFVN